MIVGPSLIVVCALHTAVGVLGSVQELTEVLADGWVGAFTGPDRAVALWFLMTGFVGATAGLAISALEHAGRMPWSVSLSLLVIGLLGVSAAPVSGFLAILLVGLVAVWRSARQTRRTPAEPSRDARPAEGRSVSATDAVTR
ncbi:DUF6463 family protein [Agromyces bauzanensis]